MNEEKDYKEIANFLVDQAVKTLGITEKAAKLRIKAIVLSGILSKFGSPDELPFQIAIDCALQIPQLGESEV